ncbi:MSMEG_0567/sll0787 family protein [Mycolicibacterium smegmatis]|jgi:putative N-acetyltransferase (TIGR04045 family)|uniref:Selenophosphate synthetase n=2 Tax=Mycolicibacterium smegmatis TaxID=1772 RepID=A0QPZ0_MYCS2|nr:MSMEG_0567/sll0787 family protein [Mycolicibacterium smegmatis]ABK70770.1 selenophosphate synthetase [Mycolicibacterium smegmatis MC2 155]AIU05836.1 AIR synthase [Mycolicibacterium smegmatis MC2 155]AIU12461.1 AIR synthase [Mycolicibacterium smegmatis]AIU19085.1 AIR synthase [Mycolicibacterium smegmatis]AWT51634.1 selenophosphate synthetase [Mycolicibacterium smegmatis MKD8]
MIEFDVSTPSLPGDLSILAGSRPTAPFLIRPAENADDLASYRRLRRDSFVVDQGMFSGSDHDDIDDDPRVVVLIAAAADGSVLGGVRLAPVGGVDLGWWTGSRLVVDRSTRITGIGAALVRAACAYAESAGVLRFEATVQRRYQPMFTALGWDPLGDVEIAARPHVWMRRQINPFDALAAATKSFLGAALNPLRAVDGALGPAGFVGDDGSPVPGTDLVAACDAIIPSLVERDPEWAGWCSVLVNINDLSAMGATPTGLLDAVAAPTRAVLDRIIGGIAAASSAWAVPVLGGHTQLGVPAALSVTALGHTVSPVPAGGGVAGDRVRLTADTTGRWRRGYTGRQWDSTTSRNSAELASMAGLVARMAPRAAKDVSMAGVVGTVGMLAEASGTGAELDVATIPRPASAGMAPWLTCFPGFGMLTVGGALGSAAVPAGVASSECGSLTAEPGVRLRWPDGVTTTALTSPVTGLGKA